MRFLRAAFRDLAMFCLRLVMDFNVPHCPKGLKKVSLIVEKPWGSLEILSLVSTLGTRAVCLRVFSVFSLKLSSCLLPSLADIIASHGGLLHLCGCQDVSNL